MSAKQTEEVDGSRPPKPSAEGVASAADEGGAFAPCCGERSSTLLREPKGGESNNR